LTESEINKVSGAAGGPMARYGRLLTDPMGEGPALASWSTFATTRRTPRASDRKVLEGLLWILRSGASLAGFARRVPLASHVLAQTARLEEQGVWLNIWGRSSELNERKQLQWSESFLDGVLPAKKGALESEKPSGQGHEVDGGGRRPGSSFGKAPLFCIPHETQLAETTLATICVGRRTHAGRPRQKPLRLIADRGYDSDPLRKRLAERGSN